MKFLDYINKSIEFLFYSLFLLVPLVFAGNTSELFEFNKMWLTFGVTAVIAALWFSKMVLLKRVIFKRTIFDIPILIFLISQIISTVISLDPHVSLWGYYSRWNGGLLSTITYIILYYAFISNFFNNGATHSDKDSLLEANPTGITVVKRSLFISVISGLLVAFWALPSHFGYDPTCLAFRGTLDVSCWTNDFQPVVRIFGPLGQPDWLAGYMGVLIPITAGFILSTFRSSKKLLNPFLIFYSVSLILFYLCVLYSGSRSGILSTILSLLFFAGVYVFLNRKDLSFVKNKFVAILIGALIIVSFFASVRLPVIEKFSLAQVQKMLTKTDQSAIKTPQQAQTPTVSALDSGGSSSFAIRKIVWEGGIDAWKANPLLGTGVETYAFAYYKYRPVEHNGLSEWNFLYNKAHNEYINYLATTGALGLLSYLAFIFLFIFVALVNIFNKKIKPIKYLGNFKAPENWNKQDPLILSLLASFLSILIINFFGFSVVILNVYLLLIPAFVLALLSLVKQDETLDRVRDVNYAQWAGVGGLFFATFVIIFVLAKFWIADTKYALGANYNRAQEYQTAYPLLRGAVDMRKEPIFEDEFSVNQAALAVNLAQAQQGGTESAQVIQQLATDSLAISDKLVREHPNNIVFWKSRVRILYSLANLDARFMPAALEAIKYTATLAPTDASILYNLGVLYGQNGDSKKAIEVLEKTISYKPDYKEAHYALALFYHDLAVSQNGAIIDEANHQKAIERVSFILEKLDPNLEQAKQSLDAWQKEK